LEALSDIGKRVDLIRDLPWSDQICLVGDMVRERKLLRASGTIAVTS
jgi:hypothetical protein